MRRLTKFARISLKEIVEEEYDQDGVIVYDPPPLNEVWLSEPEKQECLNLL